MNFLKTWFIGELSDTNSIAENRKLSLTYQYLFTYVLILLIPLPFYIQQVSTPQLVSSIIGLTGGIVPLLLLKFSKSYKTAAITYVFLGFLSNFLSIITYSEGTLEITLFPWFIVHTLFAFFTLGRKMGIAMFILSIAGSWAIELNKDLPIMMSFYTDIKINTTFKLCSNALAFIFIYFVIDSYIKLYQSSSKRIQELLGLNQQNKHQFIDLNNQNFAITEELLENQKELEENIININDLNLKLHQTENQLIALQDATRVGVIIFNLLGECIYLNGKCKQLLGINKEEIKTSDWLHHLFSEDKLTVLTNWNDFLTKQGNFNQEFRVVINGKIKWIQTMIAPIRENGVVTSFIGTITDISDSKKEKELLYLLFEMVNQSADAFYVTSESGRFVFLNQSGAELLGIDTANLDNLKIQDVSNYVGSNNNWDNHIDTLKNKQSQVFEKMFHRLDSNQQFPVELTERFHLYNQEGYIIAVAKDITERKKHEKLILRSESSLKKAQELARTGSFERDFENKEYFWSDYMFDLFSLPKETNIRTIDFRTFIPKEDLTYVNAIFSAKLKTENEFNLLYRIQRNGGEIIHVHTSIQVTRNTFGKITKLVGTIQDLTEHLKVEKLNREILQLQTDKQKDQLELEERRLDLLEKNAEMKEERIRIAAVLSGQENERKRLSRELHDGLGQMLTAIRLKMEMIDFQKLDDQTIKDRLQDVKADIKKTIFETRKISQDLMPSALEDFGILSALRILTEEFAEIKGIKVLFRDKNMTMELDTEIRITLFRIVQEALANISKHSDANKVIIEIVGNQSNVQLSITDNGSTFSNETKNNGLGIKNMKERTELLNGLFRIEQSDNMGCEINITIPIDKVENAYKELKN
jgi:PAS domain S-box-containing protein